MKKTRHLMAVASHVLLKDPSGRTLFLRRAGTGYGDGSFSVPAGHVEPGETVTAAAARELREETGIAVGENELSFVLVQHKHDTDGEERIDVFFETALPEGQDPYIADPATCDGLQWAYSDEPPSPLVPYIDAALRWLEAPERGALATFGFGRAEP